MKMVFQANEIINSLAYILTLIDLEDIIKKEYSTMNIKPIKILINLIKVGHLEFRLSGYLTILIQCGMAYIYQCIKDTEYCRKELLEAEQKLEMNVLMDNQYLQQCNYLKFVYEFSKIRSVFTPDDEFRFNQDNNVFTSVMIL